VQGLGGAREAKAMGADFIVAQGAEAGGHGAVRSTLPLVPAVVDAVDPIPVLAAGGIGDGRGLAVALALGACGAVIGTHEALIHSLVAQRLVEADDDHTQRSRVFDIARGYDWPARRFRAGVGMGRRSGGPDRRHRACRGAHRAHRLRRRGTAALAGRGVRASMVSITEITNDVFRICP